MAKTLYCWRCRTDVPMLDEQEWEEVSTLLQKGLENAKEYRRLQDAPLHQVPKPIFDAGALDRYFEITGFRETDIDALRHHRLVLFGPPCAACGKPLRTSQAKLCTECGAEAPKS
ncbi:hypothetical protein [Hypericibacter terrae]|jgi:hypothetical protein|nr:hypothetical protein [Hypericibacter terrae]